MNIEAKQHRLEEALKEAREIEKKSDLNDEERTDLLARVNKIDAMKTELEEDRQIQKTLAAEAGLTTEEFVQRNRQHRDIAKAWLDSDEYKRSVENQFRGDSPAFVFKAEPDPISVMGETANLAGLLEPRRLNQIMGLPTYPLSLASRLPSTDMGDNSEVTYFVETSETGGDETTGPTAEGAEKPNFSLEGEAESDKVEVVAGFAALTRQTLKNAPFMQGFINSRLNVKLDKVREYMILNGDGVTPEPRGFYAPGGQARGLTDAFVAGATIQDRIDAIYVASDTGLMEGGLAGDLVVINPSDWQPIVLSKDGNLRYYGSGPFAQAVGDTIWGMEVVKSVYQTAGFVLVGPFKSGGCLVLTRGGRILRTSEHHGTYFKENKVAVLLEEEMGLTVFTPAAFVNLSLAEAES